MFMRLFFHHFLIFISLFGGLRSAIGLTFLKEEFFVIARSETQKNR